MRIACLETFNGTLDYRCRRIQLWIADAQDEHILAAFAGGNSFVVSKPRLGASALDATHESGKLHVLTVRGRC